MRERTKGRARLAALAVAGLALCAGQVRAMTLPDTNLVDLLRLSETIVVGSVESVTDGIDEAGLPYTEITLEIANTIRGEVYGTGTYTFRQIGLMKPRTTSDGHVMLAAPDGIPRYSAGERVLLFLGKPAIYTGLQSTVSLGAGKFVLGAGQAENGLGNVGVFANVGVESALVNGNDTRMLETEAGAVNPDTLVSFVERAVEQEWVENCQMWDMEEGRHCGIGRREIDRNAERTRVNPGARTTVTNIGAK